MFADLHMHSTYSDGTDTPLELCCHAKRHGVRVISITDHDSVGGQKALLAQQIPQNVDVIPGIEISTEIGHKMIHILGYHIDLFDSGLEQFLAVISAEKTESTRLNFENACAKKVFSYEWPRVLEHNAGQPRIGGIHVVKAMEIDGYGIPGMEYREMFKKVFWPASDDYISVQTIGAYDAIDFVKKIGGIPIIAHPKYFDCDDTLYDLIRHGAQGLEVFHPTHTDDDTAKYLKIANDRKLYVTGGSDWHGGNSVRGRKFAMTGLASCAYPILCFYTQAVLAAQPAIVQAFY